MTGDTRIAACLALGMFALYSANGREIPSHDSQPTKYAAREFLLRGTLSLNYVVGKTPELASRSAFVKAADGRYRSAYSPVPALIAAAVTWPFWKMSLIDVRAPLAPSLMAAFTSALLMAIVAALVYLTARVSQERTPAFLLALGAGAGTGFWPTASQTLWQHESAIFGWSLAVFALMTSAHRPWLKSVLIGVGVGLATASRLQLAPGSLLIMIAAFTTTGWQRSAASSAVAAAVVVPVLYCNAVWFGTPLGAAPMLEALHESVHLTSTTFALQWEGAVGLLLSPNRGLLIFSPIVVIALAGIPSVVRGGWSTPHRWLLLAAAAQFTLYAMYSVWWGGHTYGPRYMLDILPLLVPAAAAGVAITVGPFWRSAAVAALAWSITVAALGAFTYPNERWNSDPVDVDRAHDRLWNWSDTQIARAWRVPRSPQNYRLLTRDAIRVPTP